MHAILQAQATLDKSQFTDEWLEQVRADLTIVPTDYFSGDDLEPILAFYETDATLSIGPAYALSAELVLDYQTSTGIPEDFEGCPVARHQDQQDFFSQIVDEARLGLPFIAQADTGFGKTVAGAHLIHHFQRRSLVIVPKKNLARQWKKELCEFLDVPDEEIQIVSGWQNQSSELWDDARVLICVINSLTVSAPPEDFPYRDYGVVIWDEIHRMGAREFCKSLQLFDADVRMALTATPNRKDGQDMLYKSHFGETAVIAENPPMPCKVFTVNYTNQKTIDFSKRVKPPTVLSHVAKDARRNDLAVVQITKAWEHGRVCFAVSDRIDQLGVIKQELIAEGIPPECIGIIAGSEYDPKTRKRRTIKPDEEDEVKHNDRFQIILATYGKAKEGLSIERLDWGIDLTPRADGVQMIGRIRRFVEGKPCPVWVTIHDTGVIPFTFYYRSRLKDLQTAKGVTIQ